MGLSTDAVAVTKPETLDQGNEVVLARSTAAGQRGGAIPYAQGLLGKRGALTLVLAAVGASSVQTTMMRRVLWP